jgi:hypothetical protein
VDEVGVTEAVSVKPDPNVDGFAELLRLTVDGVKAAAATENTKAVSAARAVGIRLIMARSRGGFPRADAWGYAAD